MTPGTGGERLRGNGSGRGCAENVSHVRSASKTPVVKVIRVRGLLANFWTVYVVIDVGLPSVDRSTVTPPVTFWFLFLVLVD